MIISNEKENFDMYNKHAYLITCYNNFKHLIKLLAALDDARNDIYIHVDKKAVNTV